MIYSIVKYITNYILNRTNYVPNRNTTRERGEKGGERDRDMRLCNRTDAAVCFPFFQVLSVIAVRSYARSDVIRSSGGYFSNRLLSNDRWLRGHGKKKTDSRGRYMRVNWSFVTVGRGTTRLAWRVSVDARILLVLVLIAVNLFRGRIPASIHCQGYFRSVYNYTCRPGR